MTPVYYGFPALGIPTDEGTYMIGHERIADMEKEIFDLHAIHYAETESYRATGHDGDYERLKQYEAAKQFVVFTVRKDWKMVGYLQYYVFQDVHSKSVTQAREDAFFVHPDHRGSGVAAKLLDYAEDFLHKLGCRTVGMTSKAPVGAPDIGPFLEKRGYRPIAVYYVKELEN